MIGVPGETMKKGKKPVSSWHIGVAAEAIAAAQFARCGFDVSVQYGADQPEYDLIVVNHEDGRMLKVSVKGSQDGSWGLTQSFLKQADYHGAVDQWLARHKPGTIMCFVQFHNVGFDQLPRLYLATPKEVATRLKESAKGRGDSILHEHREWTAKAHGAGSVDKIPETWCFTKDRAVGLFGSASGCSPIA